VGTHPSADARHSEAPCTARYARTHQNAVRNSTRPLPASTTARSRCTARPLKFCACSAKSSAQRPPSDCASLAGAGLHHTQCVIRRRALPIPSLSPAALPGPSFHRASFSLHLSLLWFRLFCFSCGLAHFSWFSAAIRQRGSHGRRACARTRAGAGDARHCRFWSAACRCWYVSRHPRARLCSRPPGHVPCFAPRKLRSARR